jgi:hypothetical protein
VITKPTLTPFLSDGVIKYRIGSTMASKKITLSASELEALRALIDQALGASHARAT